MGETFGGPVCLEREQPMWAILLATLVSWLGGRQCVRLRVGRGDRLNTLPVHVVGAGRTIPCRTVL
jgi:hypothetical protein